MHRALSLLAVLVACGSSSSDGDAGPNVDASVDTSIDVAADAPSSDAKAGDGGACTTRIQYGSAWMAPANHPNDFDITSGLVTWDGTCTDDGKNSFALLSDGSKPYFLGHSACIIALDASSGCNASTTCATRVAYGTGWVPPANHPATYDDFDTRVFGDGVCHGGTYVDLSNGNQPHFSGGTCPLSFSYTQCGGLYTNPTMPSGCADPGVLRDDDGTYVLSCTSGGAANAFPIYTSPDLAHWKHVGYIFPQGKHPSWSTGNSFWAPEIHKVGTHYVAYFSAENAGGFNAVGAAASTSATGPFTDIGAPLVANANIGVIDASEINTSKNESYLLWKIAGLAVQKPTPIHSQKLSADGLAVTGPVATLITNDQSWEGPSTEGPFMIERNGMFYLFYSGGVYSNATYAVGVARGTSPNAPMTKLASPILVTNSDWVGPGHCSIVPTNDGNTAMVYHAWEAGCVNQTGCNRELMLDAITWGTDGWPSMPLAPSSTTRPLF